MGIEAGRALVASYTRRIVLHKPLISTSVHQIPQNSGSHLSNERDHMACNVALGETGPSVGKEIVPFALEGRVLLRVAKSRIVFHNHICSQVGV